MNRILIGGSSSTGSSLLCTVLNRHSTLYCGPETNLFTFPELYERWRASKSRLLADGKNVRKKFESWHMHSSPELLQAAYGWTKSDLSKLIESCGDFPGFADGFFSRALQKHDKIHWVEKSPANAFYFDRFSRHFNQSLYIHTIRHPLDTIASLVNRNHTTYYAAALYLMTVSFGLRQCNDPRYFYMRYEELVRKPVIVLEKLCRHLGIVFEDGMLVPSQEDRTESTRMKGWKYHETGLVQAGSVGRFQRLPEEQKQKILSAVKNLHIKRDYAREFGLKYINISQLADFLGYTLPNLPERVHPLTRIGLKLGESRNKFARLRRGYARWNFSKYPLRMKWT